MSRYVRFRDFDWVLLIFVLIICLLGVSEIYSATLRTKFEGMHIKQMYWIMAGVVLMFLVSLINYQALLELVPDVRFSLFSLVAVLISASAIWEQSAGSISESSTFSLRNG